MVTPGIVVQLHNQRKLPPGTFELLFVTASACYLQENLPLADQTVAFLDKLRTLSALALDRVPGGSSRILGMRDYFPLIFMLHRVLPEGEACYDPEMAISTDLFASFLDWVNAQFEVVPLDGITRPDPVRRRRCALTFDDGWVDNYRFAYPLLRQRNLPATIFLPVNFIGTGRHFWQERIWHCHQSAPADFIAAVRDICSRLPWMRTLPRNTNISLAFLRRRLLQRSSQEAEEFAGLLERVLSTPPFPDRAFVTWDEVETMRADGIHFGSHTLEHCLLPVCPPDHAARELHRSHEQLQERWGSPCSLAYPWGANNLLIRSLARQAGYTCAVTTRSGALQEHDNAWALPRVAISSSVVKGLTASFSPAKVSLQPRVRSADLLRVPPAPAQIRIGFVMDGLGAWDGIPGGYLGGSELQLLKIIRALDRRYFEPEIYLLQGGGAETGITDLPVFVINPAGGELPLRRQRLLQALLHLLTTRQPDIVQGCFADGMLYGIAAAKLAKTPVIVSSRRNAGYWIGWQHRAALAVLNRFVDSWQCNAHTVEQSLVGPEWVPADRIEILPNALDLERFQPPSAEQRQQTRQRLGVEGGGPVVVAVANLRRVKQLDVLVRAAALALPHVPDLQLWLVGEGPERAALQQEAAARGIGDRVHLWGKQSDVRPWLQAADLAVLPSASEGASNAVLEYQAMGLPTILSDIPANREVGTGMFFPVGDEQTLSRHLIELWSSSQKRAEMSQFGREWVQQFSPGKMAARVQGYYSRLMADIQ